MRQFRDEEGDTWTEQPGGLFACDEYPGILPYSIEGVRENYGPLTELTPSPTDLSAPATRGDIVRVLEVLGRTLGLMGYESAEDAIIDSVADLKEGRA